MSPASWLLLYAAVDRVLEDGPAPGDVGGEGGRGIARGDAAGQDERREPRTATAPVVRELFDVYTASLHCARRTQHCPPVRPMGRSTAATAWNIGRSVGVSSGARQP